MSEPGYQGQKGLNRKLRKMGPKMTAVMKPQMKKIGEEAQSEMQKIILAEAFDSGDLARAVHMQVDSRGIGVKIGFWKAGNKKRWKLAGWRAHFVNFGTETIPAVRFSERTFNKIRKDAAKDIDRAVDRGLREVSRGN